MALRAGAASLMCPAAVEYKPVRFRAVDNIDPFTALSEWSRGEPVRHMRDRNFAVQLIRYPQFRSGDAASRVVRTFHHAAGSGDFTELDAVTAARDFVMGNAFRNFTCNCSGCGDRICTSPSRSAAPGRAATTPAPRTGRPSRATRPTTTALSPLRARTGRCPTALASRLAPRERAD